MRATLTFVLGVALAALPARADWRVTARVGGTISAVAAQGALVFVGVGSRVHIFDVTDPSAPREVGSTQSFADNVSDIFVDASRAYVAAGTDGVQVVDVSDVNNPRRIGHWDSPGSAEGLAVDGTLLYLADGPFGLQLVDLSDPASPAPIASAFDTKFAFDVVIQKPYAFIAGADAGLLIADISVPSAPREVAVLDTPGYARAIAIDGATVYLADQWGGVRVVSIAQPARPREIASVALPSWAFAVAISGTALHVATGSQGLHTLDISDPSQPRASGTYPIPLKLSWKLAVSNGRAFVGVRTEGVHILDLSQPATPRPLGMISPLVSAVAIAVRGNFAYVLTADQGMRVIDLSDPNGMQPRGAKDSIGHHGACIEAVGDRYVYVCGNVQFRAQLDVIDVSNADQPSIVTSLPVTGGGAIDLLYQGSLLYLPDEVGLEVFDVSNPAVPSLKGLIAFNPPTFGATSVAVSGTTAFINDGDNGLNALDVSDPANMRILSNLPSSMGGRVSEIVYRDGFLYGTAGLPSPEFVVLDVRDPLRMVRVGSAALPSVVSNDVLLEGPHAYVANGAGGVAVIDIRDPARPMRVAQISVPGFAKRLALKDDRLLVTAGEGGLVEIQQTTLAASVEPVVAPRRERVVTERKSVMPQTALREVVAASPPVTAGRSVVVTSLADSGPGTLREALTNLTAGDVLTFDPAVFPPDHPATIRVATQLPHLKVGGVVIDASNAGVILDGSRLSGNFDSGFEIEPPSRGNTIMGMQILNFPSAGIFIGGDGENVIGGDRSRGSGPNGQGNVISRNRKFGIHVGNPNANRIVGNFVGTDATGRVALGDQEFGVDLFFQEAGAPLGGDRVGGSEPWEANVIAGNVAGEVKLHNAGGHRVIGNFIGVDVDGNRIGNCSQGVIIDASSDNTVANNVIVAEHSVWIIDPGACCNQVVDNWIGVTKDGRVIPRQIDGEGGINVNEPFNLVFRNRFGGIRYSAVLAIAQANTIVETIIAGNTFEGLTSTQPILGNALIEVSAASRTFIGGSTAAFRNVINAGKTGVRLFGGVNRTFILGNDIGDDDPSTLQNLNGIDTESSGFTFIQNNTIANTSGKGLIIGAAGNRIRQNSIYGNQGGAISVDVAANVPDPPDIEAVSVSIVAGTACGRCTIEIFSDTGTQSRWYEGSTVAEVNGHFNFMSLRTLRGPNITATATDASGSTSALSAAVVRPPISPRRRSVRH